MEVAKTPQKKVLKARLSKDWGSLC
jgi:hypothetical protein